MTATSCTRPTPKLTGQPTHTMAPLAATHSSPGALQQMPTDHASLGPVATSCLAACFCIRRAGVVRMWVQLRMHVCQVLLPTNMHMGPCEGSWGQLARILCSTGEAVVGVCIVCVCVCVGGGGSRACTVCTGLCHLLLASDVPIRIHEPMCTLTQLPVACPKVC